MSKQTLPANRRGGNTVQCILWDYYNYNSIPDKGITRKEIYRPALLKKRDVQILNEKKWANQYVKKKYIYIYIPWSTGMYARSPKLL